MLSAFVSAQDTRLVTVDNIKLEYIDIGAGDYTLLVESGVGMGVGYWQPLLADLAKLNVRTIVYSRAGNGQSGSVDDISLQASNNRLAQLLKIIKADDNKLILLGHSFGALHVRTFAGSHPEKVAGIVLLDPSHEGFHNALSALDKDWADRDNSRLNKMLQQQPEWQQLQQLYHRNAVADSDFTQELPAVLVTSSRLNESNWWIGHSPQGKKVWRQLHASLIDKNPNAVHFVTDKSGHNVPLDDKALTLKAIDTMLLMLSAG
ncbi:alpha/beta fold hydrolase [Rheinheimera sp.]|uniref:alpha/beta fold hydrolase n=1 Tax=Rheinheimera sp. TaxID=1869214 RepID=UPI002732BF2B|nr:alpha/beta hydrolase [Rheinheimera sp.]MDP2713424.1 alpha/beta hydrolase [Rheinheimera sp.]